MRHGAAERLAVPSDLTCAQSLSSCFWRAATSPPPLTTSIHVHTSKLLTGSAGSSELPSMQEEGELTAAAKGAQGQEASDTLPY